MKSSLKHKINMGYAVVFVLMAIDPVFSFSYIVECIYVSVGGNKMFVGICTIRLEIFEAHSLKEKRQVIKSIIERLKHRFNISIAEVDMLDSWQNSEIGFACVSTEPDHARKMIQNVINFIDGDGRVEIIGQNIELL